VRTTKVNGRSASENAWLLTAVLREEFGFAGLVVSDWGAVSHRVPALLAGLDLEMPPALGGSPEAIVAAVEAGEVSADVLDARVRGPAGPRPSESPVRPTPSIWPWPPKARSSTAPYGPPSPTPAR
jgi:hypothetical protein